MNFEDFDNEVYQRLLDAVEDVDSKMHNLNEAAGYVLENLPGYVSPEQAKSLQQRIVRDIEERRNQ